MLSYTEICSLLGKDIYIYPFVKENLKGVGYNFSVGPFAWSLEKMKILESGKEDRNAFIVEPGDTALVWTNETIYVSDSIGGTFHSKVTQASMGFSAIATTLDPGWNGVLLIAITNMSKSQKHLKKGESFVTLIFDRTKDSLPEARKDASRTGRVELLNKLGIILTPEASQWIAEDYRYREEYLINKVRTENTYQGLK